MTGSPAHLIADAVIAVIVAALVLGARTRPGPWTVYAARALAMVILVNEASWWVWAGLNHALAVSYALPLQLCDLASIVSALALWSRAPLLVEVTYFWGIAGTANGLITPDLSGPSPAFPFLQYFIAHGAIVAAALFLVIGLRITPRPWAFLRVYVITVGVLLLDAFVNLLTDGNYMYLRSTPGVHSILNVMGPWPWYIAGGAVLAIALFVLLDLPFRLRRRRAPMAKSGMGAGARL